MIIQKPCRLNELFATTKKEAEATPRIGPSTSSLWSLHHITIRLTWAYVSLQVLASYINPAGCAGGPGSEAQTSGESRPHNSTALPTVLQELLSQSCLIPAMSSYLRNDSGRKTARYSITMYQCAGLYMFIHMHHRMSVLLTVQRLGGKHLCMYIIIHCVPKGFCMKLTRCGTYCIYFPWHHARFMWITSQ